MFKRLKFNLKSFAVCQSGNLTLILGVTAIPVIAVTGGAVDFARWTNANQELAIALDQSVLSAASEYARNKGSEEVAIAAALKVAKKQFDKTLMMDFDGKKPAAVFTVNAEKNGFNGTATVDLEMPFLNLIGMNATTITKKSESVVGKPQPYGDVEISVMLDTTGSMCNDGVGPCLSSTKMDALKTAAKSLVDRVIWEDQTTYKSRIAIVPFANRVRIAPDGTNSTIMSALTNMPATWTGWYKMCTASTGGGGSESAGSWACTAYSTLKYTNWKIMPCVTDRHYNTGWVFDYTDAAPGAGKWLNGHDGSRMVTAVDSSDTAPTSKKGLVNTDPADHWNYNTAGDCADVHNNNSILPLTNDIPALKARIDALSAYGGTAGTLGTAFSWYTLSPNFSSVWPASSTPKAYNLITTMGATGKPKLRKVAVLMTDGVYNSYRGWKDQDKTDMSNAAKTMCTNMKNQGIEIYTVGFNLNALPAGDKTIAINTLQNCGTDVGHFYDSLNSTALIAAFDDIGSKVKSASAGEIRLRK